MDLYMPEKTVMHSDGSIEDIGSIKLSPAQEDTALRFLIHILKSCNPCNEKFQKL